MKKRNAIPLLLAGAAVGGALYFLFNTERGRELLDRLTNTALDKLDEWLASVEEALSDAEAEAGNGVTAETY